MVFVLEGVDEAPSSFLALLNTNIKKHGHLGDSVRPGVRATALYRTSGYPER
jgi:hypothetical protein